VRNKIRRLTDAIAERSSSKALLDALSSEEAERDRLEVAIRECERKTRTPEQIPTVEWVHGVLANGFPEPTQDDVTKWAHVIRRITGPIRMFPRQHPRLTTRYPVLRFTIDFCGVLSALAASDEHPADLPDDCGCTADIELEVRKVPLYEKHATAVVHMRDVEGLSWAEIARRLPDRTCAENCIAAYRYGRFGDPWSKQPLPKCRAARRDESCEAGS
jgi:hypothetical protein